MGTAIILTGTTLFSIYAIAQNQDFKKKKTKKKKRNKKNCSILKVTRSNAYRDEGKIDTNNFPLCNK